MLSTPYTHLHLKGVLSSLAVLPGGNALQSSCTHVYTWRGMLSCLAVQAVVYIWRGMLSCENALPSSWLRLRAFTVKTGLQLICSSPGVHSRYTLHLIHTVYTVQIWWIPKTTTCTCGKQLPDTSQCSVRSVIQYHHLIQCICHKSP